jgi:DNA-binding ferritin-like protein (Dps family)
MLSSIDGYIFNQTNYSISNKNNIFNFIIEVLEVNKDEEEKLKKIIGKIKVNIGMSFFGEFKIYVLNKLDSDNFIFKLL